MSTKIYGDTRSASEGTRFGGKTIMSGGVGLSGNAKTLVPKAALMEAG